MLIIAGTGHRPQDLSFKFNEKHAECLKIKQKIRDYLLSHKNEIDYIISGMALGYDQWLAEIAMELNIKVHAYIPFTGQETTWPKQSQQRYKNLRVLLSPY